MLLARQRLKLYRKARNAMVLLSHWALGRRYYRLHKASWRTWRLLVFAIADLRYTERLRSYER